MLTSALWGGLLGLIGAIFYWRRGRELDDYGRPCLRYCGPRFGVPLVGLFFFWGGISHLDDPFYLKHPENFGVMFGFCLFAMAASVHFALYRVCVRGKTMERHAWPLSIKRYSLEEIEDVEESRQNIVMRFKDGRTFKINPLLSGRAAFLESVRALTNR